MNLETKIEILRVSKGAIEQYLFDRTVGIIAHDGGPRPIEHGTGILLQLDEEPIILTAGHVIAPYTTEQIQILATRQMSNIRVTPASKEYTGAGQLVEIDLGFLRLSEETLLGLRERKFFNLDDLEVFPTNLATDMPAVFGLPEEEHIERGQRIHRFGTFCYFPNNLEDIDWHSDEDRPRSLTIEYPDEVENAFTRTVQPLLDPHGMSGGGTWRLSYNQGSKIWSPYSMRLLGVNVEIIPGHEMEFIRAIRIEPVLDYLSKFFPSAGVRLAQAREELEKRR